MAENFGRDLCGVRDAPTQISARQLRPLERQQSCCEVSLQPGVPLSRVVSPSVLFVRSAGAINIEGLPAHSAGVKTR